MSKQRYFLPRLTADSNVISFIPTSKAGHRITALVIVLAVVSLAAASGTRPGVAGSQNSAALEMAVNPNASAGFVYFPGQYVNQATEAAEHIQAF